MAFSASQIHFISSAVSEELWKSCWIMSSNGTHCDCT